MLRKYADNGPGTIILPIINKSIRLLSDKFPFSGPTNAIAVDKVFTETIS